MPNNSFKPTPHRGVNSVLCATLHAVATPLRGGLTQALGGRKAFCGFVAREPVFIGFGWQCSSDGLSARCWLRLLCGARSAWSICSSRLPWADICAVALALPVASFGTAPVSVRGAPGLPGFGLSALALAFRSSRVPSRLTVRSSRRRFVASLKLAVGRAILALHCCVRRGLTQALGGRKAFCCFVARKPEFIGLGWQCSSGEFPVR
jgi:hypothetical protein